MWQYGDFTVVNVTCCSEFSPSLASSFLWFITHSGRMNPDSRSRQTQLCSLEGGSSTWTQSGLIGGWQPAHTHPAAPQPPPAPPAQLTGDSLPTPTCDLEAPGPLRWGSTLVPVIQLPVRLFESQRAASPPLVSADSLACPPAASVSESADAFSRC